MTFLSLVRHARTVSADYPYVGSILLFSACFALLAVAAFVAATWSSSVVLTLNSFSLAHHGMLLLASAASPLLDANIDARRKSTAAAAAAAAAVTHHHTNDCGHDHHHIHHTEGGADGAGCSSHHHNHSHSHSHSHGGGAHACEAHAAVHTHIDDDGMDASTSHHVTGSSRALGARAEYPYGVQRVEVLVQYAAHIVMIFAAGKTLVECAQKVIEQHDTSPVLVEAVSALHCLLVCATARFTDGEVLRHLRRRRHAVRREVFFYAQRCLSPVTCLVSCQLVQWTGLSRLDLLFASLLASKIALDSWRRALLLGGIALNKAPEDGSPATLYDGSSATSSDCISITRRMRREVLLVPGVLAVNSFRVWTVTPGVDTVSVALAISGEVDEAAVLASVRELLAPVAAFCTVALEATAAAAAAGGGGGLSISASGGRRPESSIAAPYQALPPPPCMERLGIPQLAPALPQFPLAPRGLRT